MFLPQSCESAISKITEFRVVPVNVFWYEVFSCKFVEEFQNKFSLEHLWRAASGNSVLFEVLAKSFSLIYSFLGTT